MGKHIDGILLHRGLGWLATGLVLLFALQLVGLALQMFPVTITLEDGTETILNPPGSLYTVPVLMLLAGAAMTGRGMLAQRAAPTARVGPTG